MKRLKQTLSQMMNGLGAQYAGEYLSDEQKYEVLGLDKGAVASLDRHGKGPGRLSNTTRRIALLTDGQNAEAAIQFAIDNCKCQSASLDIIVYGANSDELTRPSQMAERAGIRNESIRINCDEPDTLVDFLASRRGLLYLVTANEDKMVKQFSKRPHYRLRDLIPVPMVMVDQH